MTGVMPVRVQMSRQRPWLADHPDAIIVTRPSRWGNPFTADAFGAEGAVQRFERMIRRQLSIDPHLLDDLRGKDLACWCPIGESPCHGDVLLKLANAPSDHTSRCCDACGTHSMPHVGCILR